MKIRDVLASQNAYGEAHALTSHRLAELTGMTERNIRRAVYAERLEECQQIGDFICSTPNGNGGYYLAETADDVQKVIKRKEITAKRHFMSVKAGKQLMKTVEENASAPLPLESKEDGDGQKGGTHGETRE